MGFLKDMSFLNMALSDNMFDFCFNALVFGYESERIEKLEELRKKVYKEIDKLDVGFFTKKAAKHEADNLLKAESEKDVKKVLEKIERILSE